MIEPSLGNYISLGLIRDLELLADRFNCILWIRNLEYDQQLFVSHTYYSLMKQNCSTLYKDPDSWQKLLVTKGCEEFYNELKMNRTLINPQYTAIYCLKIDNNQNKWFIDRSVHLLLPITNQRIIIGCALPFADSDDFKSNQPYYSDQLDFIMTQYYRSLSSPFPLSDKKSVSNSNQERDFEILTKREKQVLKLFIQGHTMLQVANKCHLSPRTIEEYLSNLKKKLICNSKSELIMKAIEKGWLSLNI